MIFFNFLGICLMVPILQIGSIRDPLKILFLLKYQYSKRQGNLSTMLLKETKTQTRKYMCRTKKICPESTSQNNVMDWTTSRKYKGIGSIGNRTKELCSSNPGLGNSLLASPFRRLSEPYNLYASISMQEREHQHLLCIPCILIHEPSNVTTKIRVISNFVFYYISVLYIMRDSVDGKHQNNSSQFRLKH